MDKEEALVSSFTLAEKELARLRAVYSHKGRNDYSLAKVLEHLKTNFDLAFTIAETGSEASAHTIEMCHSNIRMLLRKWPLPPECIQGMLDFIVVQKTGYSEYRDERINSPPDSVLAEANALIFLINDVQEKAERPEIERLENLRLKGLDS